MAWLTNWNYRKPITVSNFGSVLSDYQVVTTVDTASLATAGKMLSSGNDIRFTSSDGSTLLNYWIESGINTSTTRIWIKIPSISSGLNVIYMYYGNATPPSDGFGSNGDNTFNFFDDFNGTTQADKWNTSGPWTESGGTIINSTGVGYIVTKLPILSGLTDFVIEGRTRSLGNYADSMLLEIKCNPSATPGLPGYQARLVFMPGAGLGSPYWAVDGIYSEGTYFASLNTWYRGKVIINPSGYHAAYLYSDTGTILGSITGLTVDSISTNNYLAIRGMNGPTELDWIFVHKYIDTEPTIGSVGIEEIVTCPIAPKYSGDTVTLNATPKDGIGPYNVVFKKGIYIIDPSRLESLPNPVTGVAENTLITRVFTLDDVDVASATGGTIDFSVYIEDSCPTGPMTCTKTCTITIGCIAPVCNFTVT